MQGFRQESANLISLFPPDATLERSPAGPEKEEILGLLIIEYDDDDEDG